MHRAPEVIDAWFDSGSMPFAQWHYPFENVETFEERFPADFIAEAIDQTRGWFYSLLAIATLIEGRSSYKRVLCLGHILDGEGQKMSKSKGNVVQPDDILDHQGADAFRWFMFSSQQPWSPRRFSAEMVDEVVRKFLLTLWNTYSFFTLYANIDRFDPTATESPVEDRPLIDRWLVGELDTLVLDVTAGLEAYDATGTARRIQQFVDDLSNWYVRRSRRRFWKSESDADKLAAYHTLYEALVTVAMLLAPFTPFVAEELYQNLVRSVDGVAPESVHLCGWPVADGQAIDAGVSFDMAAARRVVEMGRAARNAAAVKTRQPLAEVVLALPDAEAQAVDRLRDVVLDELNVKDLRFVDGEADLVAYVVKPNLKVLGPKLGKRLGPLQAALKEADGAALVAAVRADGAAVIVLPDGEISLVEEELLIETGSPEGYQVEAEGGRVVALKTDVDDALREEGLARELIHAVQLARKTADLRIEDTISLTLDVPEELRPPAERHRGAIMAETLASEFAVGEAAGDHRETARVDGHEVGIGLSVTGTIFTVSYG
jgi:isoleucyl-tRNA synthetase